MKIQKPFERFHNSSESFCVDHSPVDNQCCIRVDPAVEIKLAFSGTQFKVIRKCVPKFVIISYYVNMWYL
jgi:hypothetical protein